MFEPTILLRKNYKTSQSAHHFLEKIMKRNCERIMTIDYGMKIGPGTVLKIADTQEWLLQPELKAINDGLVYTETNDSFYIDGFEGCKHRGYLNQQG